MSYLGQTTLKSSDIRRVDVTSSTSATHTLTWTAPNEQSLIVTINGVKQQNNYTVSGTTLTMDTALVATDEVEVIGINDIGTTITPADGSVNTIQLANDAVATAKIHDDSVTADKLANSITTEIAANTAKVTNATHTGDVTGATALTIAVDAVDIPMLSATGTADATTFLRGDNSWASAGGDNTPAFQASLSADQSLTHDLMTKIAFDTEDFDTDNAYDNSTNYRFTCPTGEGGKYFVYAKVWFEGPGQGTYNISNLSIYVNGSQYSFQEFRFRNNPAESTGHMTSGVITLAEDDYVEFYGYLITTTSGAGAMKFYGKGCTAGAYKLIGV